jgi:hypothetical protein
MKMGWLGLAGAGVLLLVSGCAVNPERSSGRVVVADENVRVAVVFNDWDRKRIHAYYHARHQGRQNDRKRLPPGLAKREQLPPGLQKQVQKNGALPPGLAGRRLPPDLERELSVLPKGYVRLEVGADIVLMDSNTRIVVDVIKDLPL